MSEHLVDFQITKVFEPKKDGEPIKGHGEYGDWQLFTFYTDKTGKEKFSFMWGEKKPLPKEGLKIKHMEYEQEKRGQYINLNVKKLELPDKSTPTAIANAKEDLGPIPKATNGKKEPSYYVAYAKDMWCAMVARLPEEIVSEMKLSEEAHLVTEIGLEMMAMVAGNTPSEAQNTPVEESEPKQEADQPEPKAATKVEIIDPDGIPKVVCNKKGSDIKGREIMIMYCRNQCKLTGTCATAKQLREME